MEWLSMSFGILAILLIKGAAILALAYVGARLAIRHELQRDR